MILLAAGLGAVAVLGFTTMGAGLGIGYCRHAAAGMCSCGHPVGCRDLLGACTRQIRIRNYVSGTRRGWKYAPCACREHGEMTAGAAAEVPA